MSKKSACKIVYKGVNNICPENINHYFTVHSSDRDSKSNNLLCVDIPKPNTIFGDKNFFISGGQLWNSIPEDIKRSVSGDAFKSRIKSYLGVANTIVHVYPLSCHCIALSCVTL